jgi:hypothetical protein
MASLNLKVRRELLFNIRPLNVQLGSCCWRTGRRRTWRRVLRGFRRTEIGRVEISGFRSSGRGNRKPVDPFAYLELGHDAGSEVASAWIAGGVVLAPGEILSLHCCYTCFFLVYVTEGGNMSCSHWYLRKVGYSSCISQYKIHLEEQALEVDTKLSSQAWLPCRLACLVGQTTLFCARY